MVNETKEETTQVMSEAWPGASVEEVPTKRKSWGTAPRARVAIVIKPGLRYDVRRVYNKHDVAKNGVIQIITVDLGKGSRVAGAYVSPNYSPAALTNFLHSVITVDTGGGWLIGDFNARDGQDGEYEAEGAQAPNGGIQAQDNGPTVTYISSEWKESIKHAGRGNQKCT